VDIGTREFYRWFKQNPGAVISTACPPPGEFETVYRALAVEHDAILSIHMASTLSGTFASAEEGAAVVRDVPILLVDTGSVSMGAGFCVLAAGRVLQAGGTLAEAERAARHVAEQVELVALLATMRYVARTGRVPAIAAHAGSLLRLHPVLRVGRGRAELLTIERTTHRATRDLVERTARGLDGRPGHAAVVHADAAEAAVALAQELADCCRLVEVLLTEFTPVMGASTGPGLLGVAYYPERE
jgi:DegV family protein with EDD domain